MNVAFPLLLDAPLSSLAVSEDVADTTESAIVTMDVALRTGLRILLIITIALVVRAILHRAIRKLTQRTIDGKSPVMGGRAKKVLQAATGIVSERRRQRAETMRSVLSSVVSILLFAIAMMLVLGELGINLAPILASAGIVGVALGFGAQNLVKDYLNGICMILEDQYGVGDSVDLGEAIGTIEAVGLRTTRLRDAEGVVWYVRNGEIIRVANSSQGVATVLLDLPVAHGTDLERARSVMKEQLDQMYENESAEHGFAEAPQVQGVQAVSATGITLRAVLTVAPGARFSAAREARGRIAAAFQRNGISAPNAPFPSGATEQQ